MLSFLPTYPRRCRSLILLVALFASCCIAQSTESRQLHGSVEDTSHAAISGATISLRQAGSRHTTTTDAEGKFAFSNLTNEAADVTVSASGFAVFRASLPSGSGNIVLPITLRPDVVNTEVSITASRTALPVDQTPASVQILNSTQISQSGALELDDVLRQVAGFDLFRRTSSRTANPTTEGISLRGVGSSGASRALVLLDGVPATDPFGGWMNWSQIPRASIESVEMLRGGASNLYGGQALSGVVQVLSKVPEGTDVDLDLSYGNEGTPNGSGYLGRAFGKWLVSGAGEYFRTGGYVPVEPSQRGLVDNPANSLHRNGQFQLQRQLGQRSRFFVRGLAYDDSRHNGTIIEVNRTRSWQTSAGLDFEYQNGNLLQIRGYGGTEDYHQTFASVAANRNTETLARVQQVPSRDWGFSAQQSLAIGTRNTALMGVEFANVIGESGDEIFTGAAPSSLVNAGGRNHSVGVFGEDIARLTNRWLLTGVLRFDDWQTIDGFSRTTTLPSQQTSSTQFSDRSETAVDPKLATSYAISDRVAVRASAYRSFRSPTLNELYRSFRLGNALTLANQQLRAERLTGWEAGPTEKFLNGKLKLQQSLFWADVHRPIANVTQSTTPMLITRLRENLGSTRARGVEAQADWSMLKWSELSAQYQFVVARVTSFPANPTLVGLQVPEVPRNEFTFQARYRNPRLFTVAVQGRSSGSVFDDDQNTLPLDSYFKLDAFISRRVNGFMDIYAAGENLLNQHYMVARTTVITLGSPLVARVGLQLHLRR